MQSRPKKRGTCSVSSKLSSRCGEAKYPLAPSVSGPPYPSHRGGNENPWSAEALLGAAEFTNYSLFGIAAVALARYRAIVLEQARNLEMKLIAKIAIPATALAIALAGSVAAQAATVNPVNATASSSYSGYPASDAIDAATNTDWAANGTGPGSWIDLTLASNSI